MTTRLRAVYTRVGLNAGSASLHGLFFTRVQIPGCTTRPNWLFRGSRELNRNLRNLPGYTALAHPSLHSLT